MFSFLSRFLVSSISKSNKSESFSETKLNLVFTTKFSCSILFRLFAERRASRS
uniref:Uncharacterized protein n=1 Tax=Enterococcus faecium TaxID=1352 RepID=A3QMZ8_ENTFC|nr:hypothetical protein [Enterococcus faecium]